MSNKLIDLIDISKSYGMQTVLDELNLYIRENEFLTLTWTEWMWKNYHTSYFGRLRDAG